MSDPVATVLERSSGALTRPSSGVGRGRKGDGVDREKMLEVTLQQIEKQHGKGAVMKLGEHPMNVGMTTIPTGEQALEIADMLVRSGAMHLVVIDSVAALVPRAEIEGEMGDTHVGLQARLMSQAMRKLAGSLSKFETTAIFINQLREKIGVMFGSPETTPGGRALKFYSSVRLDVRKIENLKDGQEVIGSRVRAKVVKNKVAPPFRQCEFDIMYGKGISKEGSLLDVGVDLDIVKKSGAWFTYEGDQLGQGRENARQFLVEHVDVRDEIQRKVLEAVGLAAFEVGDDTPIESDPTVVVDEEPPAKTAKAKDAEPA